MRRNLFISSTALITVALALALTVFAKDGSAVGTGRYSSQTSLSLGPQEINAAAIALVRQSWGESFSKKQSSDSLQSKEATSKGFGRYKKPSEGFEPHKSLGAKRSRTVDQLPEKLKGQIERLALAARKQRGPGKVCVKKCFTPPNGQRLDPLLLAKARKAQNTREGSIYALLRVNPKHYRDNSLAIDGPTQVTAQSKQELTSKDGVEFVAPFVNVWIVKVPTNPESLKSIAMRDAVQWLGTFKKDQKLDRGLTNLIGLVEKYPSRYEGLNYIPLFLSVVDQQNRGLLAKRYVKRGVRLGRYIESISSYPAAVPPRIFWEVVEDPGILAAESAIGTSRTLSSEGMTFVNADYTRSNIGEPDSGFDGVGVSLGIVDTGARLIRRYANVHDALAAKQNSVCGANFIDGESQDETWRDSGSNGHGTNVASIISGSDTVSPSDVIREHRGVAPAIGERSSLIIARAVRQGINLASMQIDLLDAILWMGGAGECGQPNIVNMSVGIDTWEDNYDEDPNDDDPQGPGFPGDYPESNGTSPLDRAVKAEVFGGWNNQTNKYRYNGQIWSVAAGDDSRRNWTLHSPAVAPGALSVGAVAELDGTDTETNDTYSQGNILRPSNYGPTTDGRLHVGLVAPGLRAPLPNLDNGRTYRDVGTSNAGSSYAAAFTSGLLAQLLQSHEAYLNTPEGQQDGLPHAVGNPALVRSLAMASAVPSSGKETSHDTKYGFGWADGASLLFDIVADGKPAFITYMKDGDLRRRAPDGNLQWETIGGLNVPVEPAARLLRVVVNIDEEGTPENSSQAVVKNIAVGLDYECDDTVERWDGADTRPPDSTYYIFAQNPPAGSHCVHIVELDRPDIPAHYGLAARVVTSEVRPALSLSLDRNSVNTKCGDEFDLEATVESNGWLASAASLNATDEEDGVVGTRGESLFKDRAVGSYGFTQFRSSFTLGAIPKGRSREGKIYFDAVRKGRWFVDVKSKAANASAADKIVTVNVGIPKTPDEFTIRGANNRPLSSSDTGIYDLGWQRSNCRDLDHYEVWRSTDPAFAEEDNPDLNSAVQIYPVVDEDGEFEDDGKATSIQEVIKARDPQYQPGPEGQIFYYRVRACDNGGDDGGNAQCSSFSEAKDVNVDLKAPGAPESPWCTDNLEWHALCPTEPNNDDIYISNNGVFAVEWDAPTQGANRVYEYELVEETVISWEDWFNPGDAPWLVPSGLTPGGHFNGGDDQLNRRPSSGGPNQPIGVNLERNGGPDDSFTSETVYTGEETNWTSPEAKSAGTYRYKVRACTKPKDVEEKGDGDKPRILDDLCSDYSDKITVKVGIPVPGHNTHGHVIPGIEDNIIDPVFGPGDVTFDDGAVCRCYSPDPIDHDGVGRDNNAKKR